VGSVEPDGFSDSASFFGQMAKSKETDYEVTEGNVFAALGRENSSELLARAKLLNEVTSLIKKSGRTQQKIAKNLGITQSKVSMLVEGRLSAFSSEALMSYLRCRQKAGQKNRGYKHFFV
jgi:predicted XRE-type DNA-binding protein